MIKRIFTLLPFIYLISCGTARLSEIQAIQLAENYVQEQGYTNKDVQKDSTTFDIGFTEQLMDLEGIQSMRFNTLKPKAAFHGKTFGKWTVGFRLIQDSTRFRVVNVSRNGKKIYLEHQDVKLNVEK